MSKITEKIVLITNSANNENKVQNMLLMKGVAQAYEIIYLAIRKILNKYISFSV